MLHDMQNYKANGHKTIDAGTEMMNNMPNRIIFDNNETKYREKKKREKETEPNKQHRIQWVKLRSKRKYNAMLVLFIFFLLSFLSFHPLFCTHK